MNNSKIEVKIRANKKLLKKINETFSHRGEEDGVSFFISHVKRYIRAVKEGRMCCIIRSVSHSGMSRQISFYECDGNRKNGFRYYQFWALFKSLGYTESRGSRDTFTISGCGMDMIFHTNYTNMHDFYRLGFINKKQCDRLAQMTPTIL